MHGYHNNTYFLQIYKEEEKILKLNTLSLNEHNGFILGSWPRGYVFHNFGRGHDGHYNYAFSFYSQL